MNNKKISRLLFVIGFLLLSLIVHITVFDLFNHSKYAATGTSDREDFIRRGSIYDRNGVVLAESTGNIKNQKRQYPFKNLYSHIIGYKSRTHDTSALEKAYNSALMGELDTAVVGDVINFVEDAKYLMNGNDERKGSDITLTIDNELQKAASDALGDYKGAIVAMNPETGEILAMVSKPDFDPRDEVIYESIANAKDSALTRRATTGLYMPGSTFKIIVTCAMLESGIEDFEIDGETELKTDVTNYGNKKAIEGTINLDDAFKKSNNIYFAEAAIELGKDVLLETARNFMFEEELSLDLLATAQSTLPDRSNLSSYAAISNMALGQQDVKATPLHMAMIASAIANDGIMVQPYIVSEISDPTPFENKTKILRRCISSYNAQKVKKLMRLCVQSGTGTAAALPGIEVCGKTGTAEVDTKAKTAHAHFVGFAPYNDPKIAVAVILENVNDKVTGGGHAAPIARQVMEKYFELYN